MSNRVSSRPPGQFDHVIRGREGQYLISIHVGGQAWWTDKIDEAWHFRGPATGSPDSKLATRVAARVNGTIVRHEKAAQ